MFFQIILIIFFIITSVIGPMPAQAQLQLPASGQMVPLSPAFNPVILKGIKLDPNNPFRFHFYVDQGDGKLGDIDVSQSVSPSTLPSTKSNAVESIPGKPRKPNQEEFKAEANKLIKYFLASLTIPETDLWVNLSPYEKDRIIPKEFGQTEMAETS